MKAWGLTCSIPVEGKCNKRCAYCISEMTGFVEPNPCLIERNLPKVFMRAKNAQIETFIITSKKEPTLNMEAVLKMAHEFRDYSVEIQTNGLVFYKQPELLGDFFDKGGNTVAFSIDSITQLQKYADLLREVRARKMLVRVCLNLTDMIPVHMGFADIFNEVEKIGAVNQLLFRNVSIPSTITSGKQYEWIKEHTSEERYVMLYQEFDRIVMAQKMLPMWTLPFDGSEVWSYHGISVVFSERCIQERNHIDDIRSLIFLEDGHLYTSWGDPASVLF